MAARSDVHRAPYRSGLGAIRGPIFIPAMKEVSNGDHLIPRPFAELLLSGARRRVLVLNSKLEIGKPGKERGLQKLAMHYGYSQFVQSPLSICDLGAEQILILSVLRIAR